MCIKLRPATMDDARVLLNWKNDPVMRKFSIETHDEIKMEDHLKWLEKHLNEIYIICSHRDTYGDIRLEGNVIAIKLDPDSRGKGIGKKAIGLAQGIRDELVAYIVNGNVPSMRLFLGAGFKVTDYNEDGYYILTWKREA